MDFINLLQPYIEAGPVVLISATIVLGFVTGWLVSKGTHQREIDAHAETKELLKEALDGWKEQTKATKKANRLTQRIIDLLQLRAAITVEEENDTDL